MSTGPVPTIVSTQVQFRLLMSSDRSVAVPTVLDYAADEPYSVRTTFHTGDETIGWVFARDLLADGREGPVGSGDISIWPAVQEARRVLFISLSSPNGQALLLADVADIDAFLERSFALVPAGSESDQIDIDRLIDRIMEDATGSA